MSSFPHFILSFINPHSSDVIFFSPKGICQLFRIGKFVVILYHARRRTILISHCSGSLPTQSQEVAEASKPDMNGVLHFVILCSMHGGKFIIPCMS